MPRFGHSDDFALLFSSERSDRVDYSQGLLFGGCFVLAIFVTWTLLLMIFICLGRDKVGFLSGRPFFHQAHLGKPGGLRVFWCRVAFFTSGITFIVFTVLLVTRGITQLQQGVTTIGNAGNAIDQTLAEVNAISKSLRDLAVTGRNLRDTINTTLVLQDGQNEYCTANGRQLLEEDIGEPFDFDNEINNTIELLYDLDNFIDEDLINLQNSIDEFIFHLQLWKKRDKYQFTRKSAGENKCFPQCHHMNCMSCKKCFP